MHTLTLTSFPGQEIRIRLAPQQSRTRGSASDSASLTAGEIAVNVPLPGTDDACEPQPLTGVLNSEPRVRSGFGRLGRFTRFHRAARNRVRRLGHVLEQQYEPSESLFMTGTLPGSTPAAFEAIARYSSWLVDAFKSWLSKRCGGSERADLFVWEWQKRGALHLHWVSGFDSPQALQSVKAGFHSWWVGALRQISEKSGVDLFQRSGGSTWRDNPEVVQARAEVVTKSVGRYLSKYVSKCQSPNKWEYQRLRQRGYFCPVRWWGSSRRLTQSLDAQTVRNERDYSSFKKGYNVFETVRQVCQNIGISAIEYKDKIGSGLNMIIFGSDSSPELLSLVSSVAMEKNILMNRYDRSKTTLSLLRQAFEAIKGDKTLSDWLRYDASGSLRYTMGLLVSRDFKGSETLYEDALLLALEYDMIPYSLKRGRRELNRIMSSLRRMAFDDLRVKAVDRVVTGGVTVDGRSVAVGGVLPLPDDAYTQLEIALLE